MSTRFTDMIYGTALSSTLSRLFPRVTLLIDVALRMMLLNRASFQIALSEATH